MIASSSTSLIGALALLAVSAQAAQWDEYACMRSSGDMTNLGSYRYQSPGYCQKQCDEMKGLFLALQGEDCWCGDQPPGFNSMGGKCDLECPGWPNDKCGGHGTFSVWEVVEDFSKSSLEKNSSTASVGTVTASTAASSSSPSSGSSSGSGSGSVSGSSPSTSVSVTSSSSSSATISSAASTPTTSTSGASRRFPLLFV